MRRGRQLLIAFLVVAGFLGMVVLSNIQYRHRIAAVKDLDLLAVRDLGREMIAEFDMYHAKVHGVEASPQYAVHLELNDGQWKEQDDGLRLLRESGLTSVDLYRSHVVLQYPLSRVGLIVFGADEVKQFGCEYLIEDVWLASNGPVLEKSVE